VKVSALAVIGCAGALALGLAACGGGDNASGTAAATTGSGSSGGTADLYSSLPLQGASKDQMQSVQHGIALALSQANNKAGSTTIKYTSLDDSTAQAGTWDPAQVAQNARKVASDDKSVGYIGEFNSGGSQVSIPILNEAKIAQASPGNTYNGLTTSEPGTAKGEPAKYYPSGVRTYVRIVPRDTIQSAALVKVMMQDGCKDIAIANDQDTYGAGLSTDAELQAKKLGANIVSNEGIDPKASNYRAYAAKIKGQSADCFFFAGTTANGAVQITKDVSAAIPGIKTYGGDGICEADFTEAAKGGIPKSIAGNFKCTVATLDIKSYPGGQQFLDAYTKKFGDKTPDPYSLYGYEGARLFIDTIKGLGDKGSDRAAVLQAIMATKDRQSVLGKYSFDKNGDTTLTNYGVYKVGPDGSPLFDSAVK
jgi:branched-chain amino acid transport system substrate-binding protein